MVQSVYFHDKLLSEVHLNIYNCHKKQTFSGQKNSCGIMVNINFHNIMLKGLLNKWWFGAKKRTSLFLLFNPLCTNGFFLLDGFNKTWDGPLYVKGHRL